MELTLKHLKHSLIAAIIVVTACDASWAVTKLYTQITAPATCVTGDLWVDTNGTSGERFYTCESANTWALHLGVGPTSNPSFLSLNVSGGNLAASNKQVTKAWASGLPYTADVTSVIHGGQHYICTSTHTAGSTTEPGVGASWATVWEVASGSGFDETGDFTLTGEWDFTGATVTGLGTATLPSATEGQILQANSSGVYESTSSFAGLINDDGTGTDDLWSASKIASAISAGTGSMTYPSTGNFGYTSNGTTWASMGLDTDLATVSASDDTVPSAKAVKTALNAISVSAPTVQAADPTSASAEGWYAATGSGDIFYKSADGLFTIAGSYTADPISSTLTLDIIDGNSTDKVTVNATDRTTDGTWTGLSSATQAVTATADTGRTASCTGTGITGSYPDYIADMTQNRSIACTFADTSETIGNNTTGADQLPNDGTTIYFYPVDAQFIAGGTLASYTMTVRAQSGSRTILAGLFTYSGGTMTLVSGSATGEITYTAGADLTDITMTPTGSASVSGSVTYYIGINQSGYAAVYGTGSSGTAYSAYEGDGNLDASYGSLTTSNYGVPGKWRITKN